MQKLTRRSQLRGGVNRWLRSPAPHPLAANATSVRLSITKVHLLIVRAGQYEARKAISPNCHNLNILALISSH